MTHPALSPTLVCLAALLGLPLSLGAADQQPAIDEVVVVFKCHYDIGFTDSVAKVMEAYRTTIMDKALNVADTMNKPGEPRQFAWSVPGWPLEQLFGPGQTPERRDRVLAALRQGTVAIIGTPFTPQTEVLELEDTVQSLAFSSRISRMAGLDLPIAAKLTDVPSHSWVLPTTLTHAGIRFLHVGCNPAAGTAKVPPLFWWEGPDGSRLLTAYTVNYGSSDLPPKEWPLRTWLAMVVNNDNQGPQSADKVREHLDRIRAKYPQAKITVGSLDDAARAFARNDAERLPQLPVVRGDMPDTWIHGLMSMPVESGLARRERPSLSTLGHLDTTLRSWGVTTAPVAPILSKAFEQSLLYGEHTFGKDMKWVGYRYGEEFTKAYASGHYKDSDATFDVHRAYARTMTDLVEPALAERVAALAGAVATPGPRIVVYNPLPWARDAEVTCAVPGLSLKALRPAEGGDVVPLSTAGDRVTFLARNLPPGGYRTFIPVKADFLAPAAATADATLANRFFRIAWGPTGVTSVQDLRQHREWLRPGGVLGRYRYQRFDAHDVAGYTSTYLRFNADWALKDMGKWGLPPAKDAPHQEASPADLTAQVTRDANGQTLTLTSGRAGILTDPITTTIRLPDAQPWIEVTWSIAGKTIDPWPEAGWLEFPFAIDQPTVRLGRLGGPIDPTRDVVPGTNRDLFCLWSGLTITGTDGNGIGLSSLDAPLVSLGRPGLWRYTKEPQPASAEVFINLFNNQWSTNYPLFVGGTWSSRVRLWSVEAAASATEALLRPTWEARCPALAAASSATGGTLPAERAGLTLSRPGVLVTSFAPDVDGDHGTILRLWEQGGVAGPCTVTLPPGLEVAAVQPVDLRGRPVGAAIPVTRGSFTLTVPAYAPVSVRLPTP